MFLPPELRSNILSQLPVDTLLRFRCVSKSCCSEIDDPNFIKTQLKKSMETNSNQGMLFITDVSPDSLYSVSLDSPDRFVELDYPLKIDSILGHNMKKDGFLGDKNIRMVSCCDGLFCFSNAIGMLALMNPSTRKFQTLPFLPLEHKIGKKLDWNTWTLGFGYDPIGDDYKIVRLGQFSGRSAQYYNNETMIYNLKSNSWRKTPGMPYILGADHKMGMLLGYDLHWTAGRDRVLPTPNDFVIVAFNLGTESFTEVPVPELSGGERPVAICLGAVGEWLALTAICGGNYDIWVMKVYGVKESWIKLVSVSPNFIPDLKCVTSSYFSKNSRDEFLMGMQGRKLVWYNLEKETVRFMQMPDLGTLLSAELFHGSLVPLNSNTKKASSEIKASSKGKEKKKMNRDDFLSKGFKLKL